MKKKSKKGYKLSEETIEKLKIQAEIRKKEDEEKNIDPKAVKKAEKKAERNRKKEERKLKNEENKISLPKALETIFCMVYLGFLVICIWQFLSSAKSNKTAVLFSCLSIILCFGDSFHLIPRILDNMKKNGIKEKEFWLGLGNQISSITMTWFYLILYFAFKVIFPKHNLSLGFYLAIYITVFIRIILCLLPQNNWYSSEKNIVLSIVRNLIFLVTGILEIILFAKSGYGLWKFSIAIGLSFLFYLPVTFASNKYPKIGILMIPKTLCYSYILWIGLDLITKV